MDERILIVDDEKLIRWSLSERLSEEGYHCVQAEDGASALERVSEQGFDLAMIDLRLPDTTGVELLGRMRESVPDLPVIIITAHSTVDSAVEAMKGGARDYIAKPFNMDELTITVRNTLATVRMERRLDAQVEHQKARFGLGNLVGESAAMHEIRKVVRKISQSEATTVLLLGESGTGKDMLARAIHYESSRVTEPFMNITCTALPESLLESELFGYEKGAFTDAKQQKKGLFELANGGTVFLDEVGDMSAPLQGKLLRVLEEKVFRRIGGGEDISLDVRIIAATNRDLEKAIEMGSFREDLYYRLSIVPVLLPPLRERREDIPLLAHHFLEELNREFHRDFGGFSQKALDKLRTYGWPGNIREMRNVIERAVLLSTGEVINTDDILLGRSVLGTRPDSDRRVIQLPDGGCAVADIERDLIRQALERTSWNQTQASRLLALTRDQIRYKIEKYDIRPPISLSDE